MLALFDCFREVTLASIALRLLLSFLCGGLIGIERAYKRRPAGFRTHILICLGATMTTLTSQYLYLVMHYYTDIARLGAQVVAGIGFIGAGTIIVTHHQHVKGLTTAAGLWAAAIIGLAIGAGFYEGAILTTILILFAELVFFKLEQRILDHAPQINLYIEYTDKAVLDHILILYHNRKVKIVNMQITQYTSSEKHHASVIFTLHLNKSYLVHDLMQDILSVDGVIQAEEL